MGLSSHLSQKNAVGLSKKLTALSMGSSGFLRTKCEPFVMLLAFRMITSITPSEQPKILHREEVRRKMSLKWEPTTEERREVIECVLDFIRRVSSGKDAYPEETTILPEMIKFIF